MLDQLYGITFNFYVLDQIKDLAQSSGNSIALSSLVNSIAQQQGIEETRQKTNLRHRCYTVLRNLQASGKISLDKERHPIHKNDQFIITCLV